MYNKFLEHDVFMTSYGIQMQERLNKDPNIQSIGITGDKGNYRFILSYNGYTIDIFLEFVIITMFKYNEEYIASLNRVYRILEKYG